RLWDVATGSQLAALSGLSGAVSSVVFSPNGSRLAGASDDGRTQVWGVPNGNRGFHVTFSLPGTQAIAFSAGGEYLDIGNATKEIDVWRNPTLGLARPPIQLQQPVSVMASSPAARTLAFGGLSGSLAALDAGQRTFYQAHGVPLTVVAVSP